VDLPPPSDRPVRPVVPPASVVVDEAVVARPVLPVRNRVQWGPVVAGVLAALVVFLLLTILGIALGASVLDPANTAGDIGTWAAVWGAISAIVSFLIGGWIAARAAVIEGTFAGLLNGLSVGIAGLLLIIWLTASGLGNLFGTIGSTVTSVLNVAASVAPAAGNAVNVNPQQAGNQVEQATGVDVNNPQAAATAVVGEVQQATEQAQSTLQQADNPQTFEAVRNGAFGTFIILLVPLIASAVGGWLGKYQRDELVQDRVV